MLPAPLPRRLFEPLLEFQPRQLAPFGTQMFEIRKPDLRDQPRIGIGRRTAAGRHAVDHRLAASVMAGTMNPPGHMQNE